VSTTKLELDTQKLSIWVEHDNYHHTMSRVQWYDHVNKLSFVTLFEQEADANEFFYYMIDILNAN
jgi:hypothetical protein